MGKAEHYAILIRAAIKAARADGVNVTLDWSEDEDGMNVVMFTTAHRRGEDGFMRWIEGPYIVEGNWSAAANCPECGRMTDGWHKLDCSRRTDGQSRG